MQQGFFPSMSPAMPAAGQHDFQETDIDIQDATQKRFFPPGEQVAVFSAEHQTSLDFQETHIQEAAQKRFFPPPQVTVFSAEQHQTLLDSEDARIKDIMRPLAGASADKELATLSAQWRTQLDDLAVRFPNFAEPIQALREAFAVNQLGDGRIAFAPMLFDGPPGVGKTEMALTLAQMLEVDMIQIDMANAQSNGALCGLDRFYTDSRPGQLFNGLVRGPHANPLVFLDELDKVGKDQRYPPDSALYALLEKNIAKRFYDLSVPELMLDASHVLWIATSNDANRLAAPVRDRFNVFSIQAPSTEQLYVIMEQIYRHILRHEPWGRFMEPVLDEEVLDCLIGLSPRQIKKALYAGCGRAVYQNRYRLCRADFANRHQAAGGCKIGFI